MASKKNRKKDEIGPPPGYPPPDIILLEKHKMNESYRVEVHSWGGSTASLKKLQDMALGLIRRMEEDDNHGAKV